MNAQSLVARARESLLPRDDSIRRATTQLAALTVALVLVMLLVLEGVVYVITQQTLINSLETTLQQRSLQPDGDVYQALHLGFPGGGQGAPPGGNPSGGGNGQRPGGGNPNGGNPGGGFGGQPVTNAGPGDTSRVFLSPTLGYIHSDNSPNGLILNRAVAARVVRTQRPECCDVVKHNGTDYLVYTAPLFFNGRLIAVQQVSISEHQYQETLSTLIHSLAIVALLGLLLAGLINAALVRRALRPVHLAVQRQRDFVADAAHELRTPLAIMRTAGEVGLVSTSADDLQETVAQMLTENQHLTRLVEDLSLLARADTQTVSVAHERVDLSPLVEDTLDEVGFLAEDRQIVLRCDIQPGVVVLGDALRLRQLLLILLDNALKHTPDNSSVEVTLRVVGARVVLQVIDSGPGIPPQSLSRIFDRFYRGDSARSGEGSGLGLAIGRWIVETHGGQISAHNAQPHGAAFTVQLPVLKSAPAPSPAPVQSTSG